MIESSILSPSSLLKDDDNISLASTSSTSSSSQSSLLSLADINTSTPTSTTPPSTIPPYINDIEIKTSQDLESSLLSLFRYVDKNKLPLEYKLSAITSILNNTYLTSMEVNRFTFWSNEKPYTRNCLINNDKFTVLLLCWNPSVKSAIHDHPCDACFIKVIRGCIKETKYQLDNDNNISQLSNNFHIENQVSYMNNSNVLHSISNPNSEVGAVTLHVYTPPFSACRSWAKSGENYSIAKIGFFSYMGIRTPHLEGRPSYHALLMSEINSIKCGSGI